MQALRSSDNRRTLDAGGEQRRRRHVPGAGQLRRLPHRRHVQRGQRRPVGPLGGRHRAGARRASVRRAGRHRDQRRPAHDAVATARGRRRRALGDPGERLERRRRADGRLRRRRPSRPHVRWVVPDPVPRRVPAGTRVHADRAGDPQLHRQAGAVVRPARPGPDRRRRVRRSRAVRSGDRRGANRPGSCTTCPAERSASWPDRPECTACSSTVSRPSATANRPAQPPARCCAPAATPTPSRRGRTRPWTTSRRSSTSRPGTSARWT